MFDFPSSPAENQIYQPSGGPTYIFKTPAWRMQPTAAPNTIGLSTTYDLNGVTAQIIPVPAGAARAFLTGTVWTVGDNGVALRTSSDGTTFPSGASDYSYQGPMHYQGSGGFTSQPAANAAQMYLSFSGDHATLPITFDAQISTKRPSTSAFYQMQTFAKGHHSSATVTYRTMWLWGWPAAALHTGLTLAALRMSTTLGTAFAAGSNVTVKFG